MSGFRCPFCGMIMSVDHSTRRASFFDFDGKVGAVFYEHKPFLEINIYRCPNDSCQKETVIALGQNGYIDGKTVLIYPPSNAIRFPHYVPKAIRQDYEEACSISDQSPKASATLARRCLQGMIRDFWGIKKNRLVDEIADLQGKIPASQWAAIDALRKIGNIGAHMEKDVNTIIDVDPGEAERLIMLIELLVDKWYVARHEETTLLENIVADSESKGPAKHF